MAWEYKLIIVLALVLAVGHLYHQITQNAFENGKAEGSKAAWIDAEEQRKKEWARDAEEQKIREKASRDAIAATEQRLFAATKLHDQHQTKAVADVKKDDAVVAKVEQVITPTEAESDGLPPAADIMDALQEVVAAYKNVKNDLLAAQADYDESVELRNKVVKEGIDRDALLQAQIDEQKTQLDFYKNAFHSENKHGGFGHAMKRIFTLGIAK